MREHDSNQKRESESPWPLPGVAVLLFSLVQWQNWLWGWQIAIFLNIAAVVLAVCFLTRPAMDWVHYFASMLLSIIASYSFANGLLFWPIGLAVLLFAQKPRTPATVLRILAWVLAGVVVWVLYFTGYRPVRHPHFTYSSIDSWVEYARYVFTYLGSPLAWGNEILALLLGLSGMLIVILTVRNMARNRVAFDARFSPFLCLAAYSVGSALVTGIGRSPFGSMQALESRYTSFSVLFWIAIVLLYFTLFSSTKLRFCSCSGSWHMKTPTCLVVVVITVFAAISSGASCDHARKWRKRLIPAREELPRLENDDLLGRLYPKPDALRIAVKTLKRCQLSVFRNNGMARESQHADSEQL